MKGESLEIIRKEKLYGSNKIKLSPDKTTTITGTLDDVNTVARRGLNADGVTYNGITAAGKANNGGINILRSPEWDLIKEKYSSVNSLGETAYDWKKLQMSFGETVNKSWLDEAISRGGNIRLVSNPTSPEAIYVTDDADNFILDAAGNKIKSIFGREVDHLKANGYTFLSDGTAIR